ncbi:MAG: hypothetical protein J5845_01460 [Lachnospiraceae bacterium]|nr:hypothetical protein [Lachnospiraceae bacterium]
MKLPDANKIEKSGIVRVLLALIFFLLFMYLGMRYIGTTDFPYVLSWWLALLVLGVVMQPLCIALFSRFHDGGWIFSKALGAGVCGWLLWFLSSLKILKFTYASTFIVLFIVAAVGVVLFYFLGMKRNRKFRISEFYTRERLTAMLCSEIVFFCIYVFWCYLKGINPAAFGTERMMDYGFMLTIFKSEYMPPVDMWFSGKGINYYYFGQYLAAFLSKFSSVPVTHGYNIAMTMLAAFGFCMPYSIVNNLIRARLKDRKEEKLNEYQEKKSRLLGEIREGEPFYRPMFAGTLAGIAVAFSATMHYPVFKFIIPKLYKLLGKKDPDKYFFSNATRFIGHFYERDDKTIHEFPMYSYTLGDLHAHVVNTIFVMTLLAILFAILLRRKERVDEMRLTGMIMEAPRSLLSELFNPMIITCAFLTGLFRMTNFWDFPIYFVVSGAIILFSNLIIYDFYGKAWLLTFYQAVVFIVISRIVSLPYDLTFDSISTGIGITFRHTWFREFIVVWGLPFACLIAYVIALLFELRPKEKKEKKAKKKQPAADAPIMVYNAEEQGGEVRSDAAAERIPVAELELSDDDDDDYADSFIERILSSLTVSDLFVLTTMLCAAGLILIPEVIFVRDIYGPAYERSNTMFKLTYQAFIMFGMGMAYIVSRFLFMPKSKFQKGFGCVAFMLLIWCAGYFNQCYEDWYGGKYTTLNASAFISGKNQDDAKMIQYINDNITGQPVIAEMVGFSYTYFNRISVFTGNPTVVGWWSHEYLWRSSGGKEMTAEQKERNQDVLNLYSSTDVNVIRDIIKKYDIEYIYYGECELVNGIESKTPNQDTDYNTIKNFDGQYHTKLTSNIDVLLSVCDIVKYIPATSKKNYATYLLKVRK